MDSESDEEVYILVKFDDIPERKCIEDSIFQIVGLETETPFVQFQNNVYKGELQNSMGTNLFFENDPNPPESDPVFDVKVDKPIKFKCKSKKILNLQKVILKSKSSMDDTNCDESANGSHNEQNLPPAATIEEAMQRLQSYLTQFQEKSSTQSNNTFDKKY